MLRPRTANLVKDTLFLICCCVSVYFIAICLVLVLHAVILVSVMVLQVWCCVQAFLKTVFHNTTHHTCKMGLVTLIFEYTNPCLRQQLVSGDQHGFTHGRSCLTNLLATFEAWTRLLDEGYGLDVIYLDYRKAFDTVPHCKLIMKLSSMGIIGKLLAWLDDFFV